MKLGYLHLTLSTLFLIVSLHSTAQIDKTDRTIDFRNQLRTLWQKSANSSDIAPNIIALPILETKKKNRISVPFVSVDEKYESTIILGSDADVYLLFSDFELNGGEILTVSSVDELWESEQFTSTDNKPSGRFMIGPYSGDVLLSVTAEQSPKLEIQQVYANPINHVATELGFDASFGCHTNINCQEGGTISDEKRSVTRIRMVAEEGVGLCTGTLMNNTSGDRTPYVLTAYHCLVPPTGTFTPFYDMWWFDFNYESFSCANPEEEPAVYLSQGAVKVAEWEDTDMMLLLIDDVIPQEANVFFAGWNRDTTYVPDTTYLIHHPLGDIKKVSWDFDTAVIHNMNIGWDNGGNSPKLSHYKNEFDDSTYQPGSSGAAIFDTKGHVLGQLHGGPLADEFCTIGIGYSGRVSVSWDAGEDKSLRLKEWLDPLGTDPVQIDGIDQKQNEFVRMTGRLVTPDGIAIPDVRVSLTGDKVASFATGSDGGFVFENLDAEGSYEISFDKNTNHANGLSSSDLVIIRNHIIGRKLIDASYTLVAADVSGDDNISSVDLVQMRNLIIGRQSQFPESQSWRFIPKTLTMDGTNMTSSSMDIMVLGVKVGDVNLSANPRR